MLDIFSGNSLTPSYRAKTKHLSREIAEGHQLLAANSFFVSGIKTTPALLFLLMY